MVDQALRLTALQARNPLGFLAAVGTLEVAARFAPQARLHWMGQLNPRAVLSGVSLAELHEAVSRDQNDVVVSPVLSWPQNSPVYDDLKVTGRELSDWAAEIQRHVLAEPDQYWVADLWCGLVSEFSLDNNEMSKPTHFHFTSGQQKFLAMVRELAGSSPERFDEAWFGPWRMDSTVPVLGLDNREQRAFALRATNPAKEKKTGVPGADWLAFRGLAMYPTATHKGRLRTRACDPGWKESEFRWPVWTPPLSRDVVRSLLGDPRLVGGAAWSSNSSSELFQRSILRTYAASIHRPDRYGSFGPARVLVESVR